MKSLIQKLVETTSPSGYESQIRAVIRAEIEKHVDEMKVDAMGNLIARKSGGSKDGQKVMLSAHIDEIGIIATHVDENGFVRFTTVGGVRPLNCVGGRVRFLNGRIGVIGVERTEDPGRVPAFDQMFIDWVTAAKATEGGRYAALSDPLLIWRQARTKPDDRIGVAVLIETLAS
jgi:endoglucanase